MLVVHLCFLDPEEDDHDGLEDSGYTEASQCSHSAEPEEDWDARVWSEDTALLSGQVGDLLNEQNGFPWLLLDSAVELIIPSCTVETLAFEFIRWLVWTATLC